MNNMIRDWKKEMKYFAEPKITGLNKMSEREN